MGIEKRKIGVPLGAFPFPLTDGPQESPYLTWLRNHSNYWVVRGLLDYLRFVSVLVRGVVVNFLIFLPALLLIALCLAFFHHWMLAHPFRLTLVVLGLSILWILFFPIRIQMLQIFKYKKCIKPGNNSTVLQRDRYELSFGRFLLVILAVASFESLPWVVEWFHELVQRENLSWPGGLATVATAVAVLSGSNKLLSLLSGVKKKVLALLIGILGLLVPLLVILSATDFLVYGTPLSPFVMFVPLVVSIIGASPIVIAIVVGLCKGAFNWKDSLWISRRLGLGLVVLAGICLGGIWASTETADTFGRFQRTIDPIRDIPSLDKIANKQTIAPEVSKLLAETDIARREFERNDSAIKEAQKSEPQEKASQSVVSNSWFSFTLTPDLDAQLNEHTNFAAWKRQYFLLGQRFLTLANGLSAQSEENLTPLRQEIANLAYGELLNVLRKKLPDDDQKDEKVARLLQTKLVERFLLSTLKERFKKISDTKTSNADDDVRYPDKQMSLARTQFDTLGRWFDRSQLYDDAIRQARSALQQVSVEDLINLVTETQLAHQVKEKFDKTRPGETELTSLAGKAGLAKLLTKKEILDLVFSEPTKEEVTARTRRIFLEHALPIQSQGALQTDIALAGLAESPTTVPQENSPVKRVRSQPIAEDNLDDIPQGSASAIELAAMDYRFSILPWMTRDSDLSEKEIALVAGETLATHVLEDFNVRNLALALEFWGAQPENQQDQDPKENKEKKQVYKDWEKLRSLVGGMLLPQLTRCAFGDACTDLLSGAVSNPYQLSDKDRYKLLLAEKAVRNDFDKLIQLARKVLIDRALKTDIESSSRKQKEEYENARNHFSLRYYKDMLSEDELASIAAARFFPSSYDNLIPKLMFGKYGRLAPAQLRDVKKQLTDAVLTPKALFIFLVVVVIWLGCWFTVDVNQTSIHDLYRDRLASAFLVRQGTNGVVDIEDDLNLDDICRYDARSVAPYHLINVALNLQRSQDLGIRDRNSDFFIFSKDFIGGDRTGYCRSDTMKQVFPQMSLATAMAISAAAAAPNMGRGTSPLLVALMTMLNIRMGYWVPNPGLLEEQLDKTGWQKQRREYRKKRLNQMFWRESEKEQSQPQCSLGFTFEEVFAHELQEIQKRWNNVYPKPSERKLRSIINPKTPSTKHCLVGIGFSGGGIRSAAINLGIVQALHQRGVFAHVDYMSTVSGGGYLGVSISTLMRSQTKLFSEIAGTVRIEKEESSDITGTVTIEPATSGSGNSQIATDQKAEGEQILVVRGSEGEKRYQVSGNAELAIKNGDEVEERQLLKYCQVVVTSDEDGKPKTYPFSSDAQLKVTHGEGVRVGDSFLKPRSTKNLSEIEGSVIVERTGTKEQTVKVQGRETNGDGHRNYTFPRFDWVIVQTGDVVKKDQALIQRHNTVRERFRWRVRTAAFLREMLSELDETHDWVNLSDGGHIENLAAIELLRRRCKYIIIGDGEADPNLHFNGLATLMRCAYIDLGITIDINLDALRLKKAKDGEEKAAFSGIHWALGTITYPKQEENGQPETGYLLYLKSSFTGDEDEVICEYRHRNPTFPHQTTADQFFDEGQFEAYRALGQHIATQVLKESQFTSFPHKVSFREFERWFEELAKKQKTHKEVDVNGSQPPAA